MPNAILRNSEAAKHLLCAAKSCLLPYVIILRSKDLIEVAICGGTQASGERLLLSIWPTARSRAAID